MSSSRIKLPYVHPTVVHMLEDAAKRSPLATALVCNDESLNYVEFARCVGSFALELRAAGIGPGARVALVMSNSIDIAIAIFGVQASGAQVVPLNPAYPAYELGPLLENAQAHAIVYDVDAVHNIQTFLIRFAETCRFEIGSNARRLTHFCRDSGPAPVLFLPDPDSLSALQYTGGTTGKSKGVELSHNSVAINVSQREALLPTEAEKERVLVITPMFHVYALAMGLYLAVYCRSALFIMRQFKPDLVLQAIERHRITLLSASPTILSGLMAFEGFSQADLSSLRLCFSGASALSETTLRRWESVTGCGIAEGYGQSEAGPVLTFNPRHGIRKPGSVGIAVPETEVQIVDVTNPLEILGTGEIGEIRARGPQMMQGYRGLPSETMQSLRDGWLYTSDIGSLDADGYLYIRDRKKEMVIVSGFNVYPREIEDVLFTHPTILDVAVTGMPDSYRGEILVASVVTNDATLTPQDLIDYLAMRLTKYKVPQTILIVDSLPKTSIGKTDKNRIRLDFRK